MKFSLFPILLSFFVKSKIWYECLQNQILKFFAVTKRIYFDLKQNWKKGNNKVQEIILQLIEYVLRSLYVLMLLFVSKT